MKDNGLLLIRNKFSEKGVTLPPAIVKGIAEISPSAGAMNPALLKTLETFVLHAIYEACKGQAIVVVVIKELCTILGIDPGTVIDATKAAAVGPDKFVMPPFIQQIISAIIGGTGGVPGQLLIGVLTMVLHAVWNNNKNNPTVITMITVVCGVLGIDPKVVMS